MENFTNLSERIKQIIDYKGISINKFSALVGTSNSYFNKILRDNNSIGSDKIEKILRAFPEISAKWLILGEGEMIKGNRSISIVGNNHGINNTGDISNNNDITINHGYSKIKNKEDIQDNQEHKDKVISAMQKQIETMEKTLAYAEKNIASLEHTISLQERENTYLSEKIKTLQEEITQLKKSNERLAYENNAFQTGSQDRAAG